MGVKKALKIAGIVIGAIVAISIVSVIAIAWLAICCEPETETKFSAVAMTSDGPTTFDFGSDKLRLDFLTEETGEYISGLSVGIQVEPAGMQAAMVVIDPQGRFPAQIAILQLEGSELVIHPEFAASADSSDVPNVPITQYATSTIKTVIVDNLPRQLENLGKGTGLVKLAVLAAKALNDSGVPLGEYADKLGIVKEEKLLTRDEAAAEFWQKVQDSAKDKAFFFTDPEFIVSGGKEGIPDAQGVAIDLANFYFDANAIFSCGYANERVVVTESGPFLLYGCRTLTTQEQTQGLFRIAPEGYDERGLPLSKGSLHLVSRGQIGLGFEAPLDRGVATVSVPAGNYEVRVTNPGYLSASGNIGVGSTGISEQSYPLTPIGDGDDNDDNDNGGDGSHTVHVTIAGSGTVTSRDGVIDCPGTCSGTLVDEFTFLEAEPSDGWYIAGWDGAGCEASYYSCPMTPKDLQGDIYVTVNFGRYPD